MALKEIRSVVRRCRHGFKNFVSSHLPVAPICSAVLRSSDESLYLAPDVAVPIIPSNPERSDGLPASQRLVSCLCTAEQVESDAFRYWAKILKLDFTYQRKLWEFCYICQSLYERGLLAPGRRGLGFAVGQEPLSAMFASRGCQIVATDLDGSDPRSRDWSDTSQWAADASALNQSGICDPAVFRDRVSFRPVDMNHIPDQLGGFDFTWSSCSFEHCGSIELGLEFLFKQMKCLKPSGVAVHTTEFNLTSNDDTITTGGTVIFRRSDIERIVRRLMDDGHSVEPIDLSIGAHSFNHIVDRAPYFRGKAHLRLELRKDWWSSFASTSIGLIIRKAGSPG